MRIILIGQAAFAEKSLEKLLSQGEEIVAHVKGVRREDVHLSQKGRMDLIPGLPNRGGRGDDFGPYRLAVHLPRAQLVHRCFVKADERAQRPGDQVQLILNYEVRRAETMIQSEKTSGLRAPWQHGELVNCSDQ